MKQPTSEWTGPWRAHSPQRDHPTPISLSIVDSDAMLTYDGPDHAELGTHHFVVELRNVPSTDDANLPSLLHRRRGRLCEATIGCLQANAGRWIGQQLAETGADDEDLTFRDIQLVCGDTSLAILGRVSAGAHTADFLFRGELLPWGQRWVRVSLADLRVYGAFPVAAPLLSAALLRNIARSLSSPSTPTPLWPTARRGGATELVIDALALALLRTLPAYGYRLPTIDAVRLQEVVSADQQIALQFGLSGRRPEHAHFRLGVPPLTDLSPLMDVDEQILGLGAEGALEHLRGLQREHRGDAALLERLIQLSCADANLDTHTLQLCAQARNQGLDSTQLLLAEASVQLRRGRADEATLCFGGLAELAARLGDPLAELQASVAASRCATYDRPDEALAYATRALAINGEHRGAMRQLARLYASTGQWEQLVALRRRLLELAESEKDKLNQHLALGELYRLHLTDPATAMIHYEAALDIDDSSEPALRGAAEAKAEIGDLDHALTILGRLCEVAVRNKHRETEAAARLRIAVLLEQIGQCEAALGQLERARTLNPARNHVEQQTLRHMASLLIKTSRPTEAIRVLRELSGISDDLAERATVHRRIAVLYVKSLADLERAHAEILHALALEPSSPARREAHDAAEKESKAHLAAWDELADTLRDRCASLQDSVEGVEQRLRLASVLEDRLQRPVDALGVLEEAAALAPRDRRVIFALADTSYRAGQWPRSRELYEQLTRNTEGVADADAWHRFGVVNEALGDEIGADKCYGKAIAARPDHRPAVEDRARLALVRGDNTLAIALLTTLCDLLSVDEVARRAETREQLGELLARKGNDKTARHHLEAALSIDPRRIKAVELLRAVAERTKDFETAIAMAQRLDGMIDEPFKRAALLHHQAQLYRSRLGDTAAAAECLLRAYDIAPTHTPILWQLVDHYWSEGDLQSVAQLEEELRIAGVTLTTVPDLRQVQVAAAVLLDRGDQLAARGALLAGVADDALAVPALLAIARAIDLKAQDAQGSRAVGRVCATLAGATPSGWLSDLAERVTQSHADAPGLQRLASELRQRRKAFE